MNEPGMNERGRGMGAGKLKGFGEMRIGCSI